VRALSDLVDRLLDHPSLSSRMFYPMRVGLADPYWVVTSDGHRLACHRSGARAGAPTILFFHGNGEVVADYVPSLPQLFEGLGCNVVLAEYRGYGMSTGAPGLQTILDDVGAVLDAIDVPDGELVLYGRSLGSLCALRGARLRPAAAALIVDSGIFDPLERVERRVRAREMGVDERALAETVARELDPVPTLKAFRGRTLILHTRDDELVDVSHARGLYRHAPEPKTLLMFERGDHNSIFEDNRDAYVGALKTLLAGCQEPRV
jgi:pimeloyl-ACP methyl ester carboxylesterase